MQNDDEAPFRVYSERQLSVSHFEWNPYMDLMSLLPLDVSNPSFSVLRLINDKHTNSPLLFSEKLPFPGTTTAWVPDKRGLSVGDSMGNVFVFDAEHQRTIELHKVHEGPISKLSWNTVSRHVWSVSGYKFLPSLFPMPLSLEEAVGDPIVCDSLATCEDRITFLSVLSVSGNLSIYYGGSIPVCEINVSVLFGMSGTFSDCLVSADLRTISVLAKNSKSQATGLLSMNSSILALRMSSLVRMCRLEARFHWLLKLLISQIEVAKTRVSIIDYLRVVLTSRIRVIVSHLMLVVAELREMNALGLDLSQVIELEGTMQREVVDLLEAMINKVLSDDETVDFSEILNGVKKSESQYILILSNQRKVFASKIVPRREIVLLSETTSAVEMMADNKLVWLEQGQLVVWRDGIRTIFVPPPGSIWKLAKFYRNDKICLLLVHENNAASLCLLAVDSWQDCVVESSSYGFAAFLQLQQLPAWCSHAESMAVSIARGLCSIYAKGQLLTLDLEMDEQDIEEVEEEETRQVTRHRKLHDSLVDQNEILSPEMIF